MAAFSAIVGGELPPVGQRVSARRTIASAPSFSGYEVHWVANGTAALAIALKTARAQRPEIRTPKVLLPAYGCPDLIAAAVYANVEPVLVDIGAKDPGFVLADLEERCVAEVVAIVAVNFLGIRERIQPLRALADARNLFLIEDSAQWYPETEVGIDFMADAVVLSFGRGKPVNLLGGGALLLRSGSAMPEALSSAIDPVSRLSFVARAFAFNILLHRLPYGLVAQQSVLALGETRYKALSRIGVMDEVRRAQLARNVDRWLGRDRWREQALNAQLSELEGLEALPRTLANRAHRLLRYPVLMHNRGLRDRALDALSKAGLGSSAMYRLPLPDVPAVPVAVTTQRGFTGAAQFADRLLTLPVHDGVRSNDLDRMVELLRTMSAQS